jgi:hypothetical protein
LCARHQELSAVHLAIGTFHAGYVAASFDCPRKRPHNLHETYQLPSVQLITPDDGHGRCPKPVDFRDKIHFGYLMQLVCYFIEAYHDARSLEHKLHQYRRFAFDISALSAAFFPPDKH